MLILIVILLFLNVQCESPEVDTPPSLIRTTLIKINNTMNEFINTTHRYHQLYLDDRPKFNEIIKSKIYYVCEHVQAKIEDAPYFIYHGILVIFYHIWNETTNCFVISWDILNMTIENTMYIIEQFLDKPWSLAYYIRLIWNSAFKK